MDAAAEKGDAQDANRDTSRADVGDGQQDTGVGGSGAIGGHGGGGGATGGSVGAAGGGIAGNAGAGGIAGNAGAGGIAGNAGGAAAGRDAGDDLADSGGGDADSDGASADSGPDGAANGASCSGGGECASGICVVGHCCGGPCDGACMACTTGTCAPVPNGANPGRCEGWVTCSRNQCIPRVRVIASGGEHTCVLLEDGQIKCWGENVHGQLGLGDTRDRGGAATDMGDLLPVVPLGTGRSATDVVAGDQHTCALLDDGRVKCWGYNRDGELGQGDAVDRGSQPFQMGDALPPIDLGTDRTVKALTAGGGSHTCALLDNGRIKCWGANYAGQLGIGNTTSQGDQSGQMGEALPSVDLGMGAMPSEVSAGSAHTCAVLKTGQAKCWGSNGSGQLGQGSMQNLGIDAAQMGDALPPIALGTNLTATSILAAGDHSCAILNGGLLKCWGDNGYGQLGLGDTVNRGVRGAQMGDALQPVALGSMRAPVHLAGDLDETCAVLDNGDLKCWGNNSYGQLGTGDGLRHGDQHDGMGDNLPPVPLGSGRTARAVAAGYFYTCSVLDDGQPKCWGRDLIGELGQGDLQGRGTSTDTLGDALSEVDLGRSCPADSDCVAPLICVAQSCGRKYDGQPCTAGTECISGSCNVYYPDADHDGYGDAQSMLTECGTVAPPGQLTVAGDCCDRDMRVFPGETTYYSTERNCGGYDFDCDGSESPLYPNVITTTCSPGKAACQGGCAVGCVSGANGWTGKVAACGATGSYETCSSMPTGGNPVSCMGMTCDGSPSPGLFALCLANDPISRLQSCR